jgi:hypothetical protein
MRCRAAGPPDTGARRGSMSSISYRALRAEEVGAVFDAAREAWQFTYATIFDPVFIDQFVRTNYAPDRLSALGALGRGPANVLRRGARW